MKIYNIIFAPLFFILVFPVAGKGQLNRSIRERDSLIAVSILNLDSNFVFVQGGTFLMGLPDESLIEGGEISKPQHKVALKSFYILKTPVTQALWCSLMDSNPSFHKNCYTCPVENVSWNDAQEFVNRLNALKKGHYRLPTEAEYEYAARGGNKSKGFTYSGSIEETDVAWFVDNSNGQSHPVGQKKANELGLKDMSGNVWELCSDWYGMFYYKDSPTDNPQGPTNSDKKVVRGGTWSSLDEGCLVTSRGAVRLSSKDKYTGFRIVRDQ